MADELFEGLLFEQLPTGVCIFDKDGLIKYFNPKASQLWGREPQDLTGRFCGSYQLFNIDGSPLPHKSSPVALCLLDGRTFENHELRIGKPDGLMIDVRMNVAPIIDKTGGLLGAINCFSDVTRQQDEKAALDRKNHELQEYIDNAAIGLHWVDANGIIKWANQAELDMLGYVKDEYIGRHISDFHVHLHKIEDIMARLQANETLQQVESEMICKDGSIRIVQITSNVFREEGQFIHTRCFTVDVTPQKQLLLSLNESEHRYRELVEGLPAALYTTDVEGRINLFNHAAADLWGRRPTLGQDLWCGSWKIYRPDGKPVPLDSCLMAIALKERRAVFGEQIIIERPDGSRRNVLPYPQPTFDVDGRLTGAVNMLIDVTTLKKVEEELRESEQRFKVAANTAPVLIWMGETATNRSFFNNCWLEFTGRSIDDEMGLGWMDGIYPADIELVRETCDSSFVAHKEYKIQYRLRKHTGQYRWVHSQGRPRYMPDGKFSGYIGTITDIHEQKLRREVLKRHVSERTQQLQEANKQLARSNNELESFAYMASHDLQEPLRKIHSIGTLLEDRYGAVLGERGTDLVRRMQSASSRMSVLIEGLLNYSRISTLPERHQVDLNFEVKEVLSDLETLIKDTSADIRVGNLRPVLGYAPQIRQLFQNLISNALKFTNVANPVVVQISSHLVKGSQSGFEVIEEDIDRDFQLIEVTDNGIGFDPKYSQQIFEVFRRLHGKSEFAGTGIGLSIVKRVIDAHDGYIQAIGHPGEGATFKLLLPVW